MASPQTWMPSSPWPENMISRLSKTLLKRMAPGTVIVEPDLWATLVVLAFTLLKISAHVVMAVLSLLTTGTSQRAFGDSAITAVSRNKKLQTLASKSAGVWCQH